MQIEVYKTTPYIELLIQSSCSRGNSRKNKIFLAVNQTGRQLTHSWHSHLLITSTGFLATVQVQANKTADIAPVSFNGTKTFQ